MGILDPQIVYMALENTHHTFGLISLSLLFRLDSISPAHSHPYGTVVWANNQNLVKGRPSKLLHTELN